LTASQAMQERLRQTTAQVRKSGSLALSGTCTLRSIGVVGTEYCNRISGACRILADVRVRS
jgi:hypothetical protein